MKNPALTLFSFFAIASNANKDKSIDCNKITEPCMLRSNHLFYKDETCLDFNKQESLINVSFDYDENFKKPMTEIVKEKLLAVIRNKQLHDVFKKNHINIVVSDNDNYMQNATLENDSLFVYHHDLFIDKYIKASFNHHIQAMIDDINIKCEVNSAQI